MPKENNLSPCEEFSDRDDFASGRASTPGFTSAETQAPQMLTDMDGDLPRQSTSDEDFQARAARNEQANRRGYKPVEEKETNP